MEGVEGNISRGWGPRFLAPAAFTLSFLLPLIITFQFVARWSNSRPSGELSTLEKQPGSFPQSVGFHAAALGDVVRVSHVPALNPTPNWLVYGWFQVDVLPALGKKVFLFSKHDPEHAPYQGYALALENVAGDTLLPKVYWKGSEGEGRWFSFSNIEAEIGADLFFALGLDKAGRLALFYTAEGLVSDKPSSLGAYEVETSDLPASSTDFVSGAVSSGPLIGKIMALGVLNFQEVEGSLPAVVAQVLHREPDQTENLDALQWVFRVDTRSEEDLLKPDDGLLFFIKGGQASESFVTEGESHRSKGKSKNVRKGHKKGKAS